MKIGLFCKKNDANARAKSLEFSVESGFECVFLDETSSKVDIIITFGGDGTVLQAVKYAIIHDAPIVSIHMGHLGFLCAYSSEDLQKVYQLIRDNSICYEEKILLHTQLGSREFYSLNEITVQREICENVYGTAAKLQLYINDDFADEYLADGIILSTPSGSTAYSLSAGGAVLTPDLNAFITTAICPHSLHNRPIVFGSENVAKIVVRKCDTPCKVFSDGNYVCDIQKKQELVCKKSSKKIKISVNESYFSKLNKKLRFWGNGG